MTYRCQPSVLSCSDEWVRLTEMWLWTALNLILIAALYFYWVMRSCKAPSWNTAAEVMGDFNPKLIVQNQRYKNLFRNLRYMATESSLGIPLKGMQYVCMKNREEKAKYAKLTTIGNIVLTKSQRRVFCAELSDDWRCEQRQSPAIWVLFCSGKQDGIREIADSTNQFFLLTETTCNAQSCELAGKRGYNTHALLARMVMMV